MRRAGKLHNSLAPRLIEDESADDQILPREYFGRFGCQGASRSKYHCFHPAALPRFSRELTSDCAKSNSSYQLL